MKRNRINIGKLPKNKILDSSHNQDRLNKLDYKSNDLEEYSDFNKLSCVEQFSGPNEEVIECKIENKKNLNIYEKNKELDCQNYHISKNKFQMKNENINTNISFNNFQDFSDKYEKENVKIEEIFGNEKILNHEGIIPFGDFNDLNYVDVNKNSQLNKNYDFISDEKYKLNLNIDKSNLISDCSGRNFLKKNSIKISEDNKINFANTSNEKLFNYLITNFKSKNIEKNDNIFEKKKQIHDKTNEKIGRSNLNLFEKKTLNSVNNKEMKIVDDNRHEIDKNVEKEIIENNQNTAIQKFNSTLSQSTFKSPSKKRIEIEKSNSFIRQITQFKEFSLKYDDDYDEQLNNKNTKEFIDRKRKMEKFLFVFDSLSEDEEEIQFHKFFVINMNSFQRYSIDLLVLIAIIYSTFATPLKLIFIYDTSIYSIIIEMFLDLILILDMFTGFFKAFYDFEENYIQNFQETSHNYLREYFILDFISGFPINSIFEIKYYLISAESKKNYLNKIKIDDFNFLLNSNWNFFEVIIGNNGNILHLTRIFRIFKVFNIYNGNEILKRLNDKITYDHALFHTIKKFTTIYLLFMVISHILTCIHIFLASLDPINWITFNNLQNSNFSDIYLSSLYFHHTTIFSIGYGDITSKNNYERIYNIILMIVGVFLYSFALTSVSNIFKQYTKKYKYYDEKKQYLNNLTKKYHISFSLYKKISRHLLFITKKNEKSNKFLFVDLPLLLRNELILKMNQDLIKNSLFFKNTFNNEFLIQVFLNIKPTISKEKDLLINQGDFVEEVIFIHKGIIQLETLINFQSENENSSKNDFISKRENEVFNSSSFIEKNAFFKFKVMKLKRFDYFGDALIIENERSPLSIKTKSKTAELFLLNKFDLLKLLKDYPKILKNIFKNSNSLMKKINEIIDSVKKLSQNAKLKNNINSNLQIKRVENKTTIMKHFGNTLSTRLRKLSKFVEKSKDEEFESDLESLKNLEKNESDKKNKQHTSMINFENDIEKINNQYNSNKFEISGIDNTNIKEKRKSNFEENDIFQLVDMRTGREFYQTNSTMNLGLNKEFIDMSNNLNDVEDIDKTKEQGNEKIYCQDKQKINFDLNYSKYISSNSENSFKENKKIKIKCSRSSKNLKIVEETHNKQNSNLIRSNDHLNNGKKKYKKSLNKIKKNLNSKKDRSLRIDTLYNKIKGGMSIINKCKHCENENYIEIGKSEIMEYFMTNNQIERVNSIYFYGSTSAESDFEVFKNKNYKLKDFYISTEMCFSIESEFFSKNENNYYNSYNIQYNKNYFGNDINIDNQKTNEVEFLNEIKVINNQKKKYDKYKSWDFRVNNNRNDEKDSVYPKKNLTKISNLKSFSTLKIDENFEKKNSTQKKSSNNLNFETKSFGLDDKNISSFFQNFLHNKRKKVGHLNIKYNIDRLDKIFSKFKERFKEFL